jgi:hypothetical protein
MQSVDGSVYTDGKMLPPVQINVDRKPSLSAKWTSFCWARSLLLYERGTTLTVRMRPLYNRRVVGGQKATMCEQVEEFILALRDKDSDILAVFRGPQSPGLVFCRPNIRCKNFIPSLFMGIRFDENKASQHLPHSGPCVSLSPHHVSSSLRSH